MYDPIMNILHSHVSDVVGIEVGVEVTVEGTVDGGVPVSSMTDMGAQFNT